MIEYADVNKKYRYILIVIDAFSKFVWAEPIKNKTAIDVATAMKRIFTKSKRIPKNLQTDKGKEFYNKLFKALMQKHKINHYSTHDTPKACIVERVNRTLKTLMWKEFSFQGSFKWLNLLPEIVNKYNNTKHSTTGQKPSAITKRNEKKILKQAYNRIKTVDLKNVKFKIGDRVRISKYRTAFEKGYTPNWTNEIFTISQVRFTNPITYLLKEDSGNKIEGAFYGLQLQKVMNDNYYLIEKILREKNNKALVKWLGFPDSYNSWIDINDIL